MGRVIRPALTPRTLGLIAAVVTVAIWTAFIVIARASTTHTLTTPDIVAARIVGAAAVLLPWGWWWVRRHGLPGWLGLSPLGWRLTALTGVFGGLAYPVLAYSGFVYAPAAHGSVLLPGSLPLWTTLLAMWLLGERPTRARAFGLACILAGDLLVGGASLLQAFDGGQVWRGDLLFMAGAACWSLYTVLVRRHALSAVTATMAVTVFASVTYLPAFAVLTLSGVLPTQLHVAPAGEVLFQALFQGVGSVVISGITFTRMVQTYGPVRSTMITALVPGLSALGAVWLLGEPLHATLLLGLALVTLGITFGVRTRTVKP